MSQNKPVPYIVTLDKDRIGVRHRDFSFEKDISEDFTQADDSPIADFYKQDTQKTRKKLGLWLYHELPVPQLDAITGLPVFEIRDRMTWGHVPWETLFDGTQFLLAETGARFQVFLGSKRPGEKARRLGPINNIKVALIDATLSANEMSPNNRGRRELIARLEESPGFYLIQGDNPQDVQRKLKGIRPHIAIMDANSSTHLGSEFYNPPEDPDSEDVEEQNPGEVHHWYQATASYLFSDSGPPLVIAPSNENFAFDALAAGADTVVLCSRLPIADNDFYDLASALVDALDTGLTMEDAFGDAVGSWRNSRESSEQTIPVLYNRFPFRESEIDDGFDDIVDSDRIDDGFDDDVGETIDIPESIEQTLNPNDSNFAAQIAEQAFAPNALAEDSGLEVVSIDEPAAPRTPPPVPGLRTATELSAYRSDVAATTDRLGVQADVENICQVIMAEQWKPPLSIGLFGDWGSGKTSFINLMRKTINATARRARDGDSAFVKDVIQIDFNAWHYLDANLWANLVVRILEGIQTEVFGTAEKDEEGEEYRQIFDRLHVLQEELEKANEQQERLTTVVTDLDGQITTKEQEEATAKSTLLTLKAALADSDNEIAKQFNEVKKQLETAVSSLDLGKDATLAEARAEAEKYQQLGVRIRKAWKETSKNRQWWLVLPLAAIIFWIGADPDWAWLSSVPVLKEFGGFLATAASSLLAWSQTLAPHLSNINSGLDALHTANTEVAKFKTGWIRATEKEIFGLETRRQEALDQLNELKSQRAEKQSEQEGLRQRVEELERGKGLEEFLMSRAGSTDYQQQLGIIALVHKDMRKLQQKLRAGMKVVENGKERQKKYDRVILYIDDLDRCTPARVVEVLQAIHLLLSIPLFVVVVAVDPGWLLQCLLTHYQDLLHKESGIENTEWRLTPQNYLEKIFQIPFTLPTMGSRDFPGYVDELFKLSRDAESDRADQLDLDRHRLENELTFQQGEIRRLEKEVAPQGDVEVNQAPKQAELDQSAAQAKRPAKSKTDKEALKRLLEQRAQLDQKRVELLKAAKRQDKAEPEGSGMELRFDSNPRALNVSGDEKKFVKKLLPLLTTPRMTKRMLNVYRLIRVSLGEVEIDAFEESEHQAVLILLAVMYSYPSIATEFFIGIKSTAATTMEDYIKEIRDRQDTSTMQNHSIWRRLLDSIDQVEAVADLEIYDRWTRVVGRYSFQVGHELSREQALD